MARSSGLPSGQPPGGFTHALSGTAFQIHSGSAGVSQSIQRRGIGAEYAVAYSIGSGSRAIAYLIQVGDYLFQSPISYYTKRELWDMAPGYESDSLPDFTRPVTPECLLCHTGNSSPVNGTINRYKQPAIGTPGISCDRCHGPVASHLRDPSRNNIINPVRLPAKARDSVCEQCHLTGEARIANPGRKLSDFEPGRELEDYYSVYVFDSPIPSKSTPSIKVVSHAEQLALSMCARKSGGRLWCGTCHNPHVKASRDSYRERCLSCHGQVLAKSHSTASRECVACHMPSRPARDGGHTAFTDHRIMKRTDAGVDNGHERLVAWRDPPKPLANRNLGLAYITVGERDRLPEYLERGYQLLLEEQGSFTSDPAFLTGLGVAYMRKHLPRDALREFERAAAVEPDSAPAQVNLAAAFLEIGQAGVAIERLNRAIQLDPSMEVAYRRLADAYAKQHDEYDLRKTFERYLQFRPKSLAAREALRR